MEQGNITQSTPVSKSPFSCKVVSSALFVHSKEKHPQIKIIPFLACAFSLFIFFSVSKFWIVCKPKSDSSLILVHPICACHGTCGSHTPIHSIKEQELRLWDGPVTSVPENFLKILLRLLNQNKLKKKKIKKRKNKRPMLVWGTSDYGFVLVFFEEEKLMNMTNASLFIELKFGRKVLCIGVWGKIE